MELVDLKNDFICEQVYEIYSACMYKSSWERFCEQGRLLVGDGLVSI